MAIITICCRYIVFVSLAINYRIIEDKKLNIEKLKERFNDTEYLLTKDIAEFYLSLDPLVKKTTINWRVYALIRKGILTRIGRGKFCFGSSKIFAPGLNRKEKVIYNKLKSEFPFVDICVWNTKILNEFMQHQPGNFQIIVEVEKEVSQSVFYFLKELNYPVFIEPTEEILEKYLPTDKEAIIIKSLVSESPLQESGNIRTITIEKLLVDIFSDSIIFSAQQGAELRTIFQEAFNKYTVNQSKMLRYASRRRKKDSFQAYLSTIQIYGSKNQDAAKL
ncbi:DUF6577 family protein [Saccharicrinis fermentans]|uniref:Uncharacterized protein n=1 Tax=Saccharicrinis fermentans DSM 9555 = JCM 21142 TaxID=869213 RepID=W7YTG8_9BACT|nr:DUF6577 family protein [Saccharicrinis fermentans]GAF05739.1 hypothetical protein JCM21142_104490 [Saccharicrinis fermentans DSM 9555 = JCM 21142]